MRLLRDNGLTFALLLMTIITLTGMALTGLSVENAELATHGASPIDLGRYLVSGAFLSALFENWESEFLQMSAYVVLTAFLFQRGSSESKDPDATEEVDEDPRLSRNDRSAPKPVRADGLILWVYSYSLGIVLILLFVVSFVLHWLNSAAAANNAAAFHELPAGSLIEHLGSSQLWFESFQNWQSEFLSTAVIVVLSIFLRFRFSPESKPVAAPHSRTGN